MTTLTQPSDIARETLRQLAMRRIPPTPDNYHALYHEISGTTAAEGFPERALKHLAGALPRNTPEQMRFARQLDGAVAGKSWDGLKVALVDMLDKSAAEPPAWAALIRDLVVQFEARHAELTTARKRESLEHVLASSGTPETLHGRLQSLLRAWSQGVSSSEALKLTEATPTAAVAADTAVPPEPTFAAAAAAPAQTRQLGGDLKDLIGQLLENAIGVLLVETPDLADEARQLAAAVRATRSTEDIATFAARMKKFSYRLNFVAEDQAELKAALLKLLQLIIVNINELILDDQWLQGQVSVVLDIVSQPLNLRRLDDVERCLKEVIVKQSTLKKHLNDARDRLKAMLATFVDRLASFTDETGGYHDKIESCAKKISRTNDIGELSDVLDEVMRETRVIQLSAQRSRDELTEMKSRVTEAEQEIARLQTELSDAGDVMRHDALTGALNRKGMDEAIDTEVSRVKRHGTTLCMALLDIDNFKKLNDSLGHDAGDAALVHLTQVTKETIRPQDTLARYGGEEFVVLLPDTTLDDAVTAMVRVQRELTKRFFLHKNDKVLITFSCGVAELHGDEAPMDAIKRADQAMYLAKRSGKNRVVAG
ncbi:MAG: GGDEF domain-containing protein [Sulfurisoma sp.]|nr:GGDEF domain-containing protein [Sulfurisoma sp.]